ncbi:hypothetical protein MNBD_ACTINO01-385 [hydrothermal vent metagenome]|uniref:Uncharacterized protein n=1 Tax=hydrothermal vent metagenome TaxID=652676 RepID=A0A3B0R7P4_9ZZZZ
MMAEFADILDKLNELPDDAIAQRGLLRERQYDLRSSLASLQADERAELTEEWSAQAAAKAADRPGFVPGLSTETSGGAGDSAGGDGF